MKQTTGDPELDALIGDEDPKEVFRRLKIEEAKRLDGRKFGFYEPNGKCEEYIKAVGSGDNFVVFFSAANGVGKTAASANIVAHILFPELSDNPYFNYPLFREKWKFPTVGRIVTDPNNIPNVVTALKEWLPKGKYTCKKGTKSHEAYWKAGDWEIEIMSYEQDAKEFEGRTLGFVWFDEPPPEAIYKANIARLRMGGIMFISATPLAGSGWLYDSFVATEKMTSEDLDGNPIDRKIAHIEADVEAACIQHGVRGHLDHSNIQQIIAEYDEEERQARVHGKFQHLVGLVYKRFNRKIHVIKPFQVDFRRFCVFHALDPHPRNPDAGMWLAVDQQGTKYVVDELYLKCTNGTEELAQLIKQKNEKYRLIRKIIDPSAFVENQHEEDEMAKSLADKLSNKYGLSYLPATKSREAANKRIEDALAFTQIPTGEFITAPELFIFETCTRTIWEIEHLRWQEWKGKTGEEKSRKEKPVDKDDHMIENLGRLLIQEPAFEIFSVSVNAGARNDGRSSLDPYQ